MGNLGFNRNYIVYLHDDIIETTIIHNNRFIGNLVNKTARTFYFELNNDNNSIAIIPHNWIKFMYPYRKQIEGGESE